MWNGDQHVDWSVDDGLPSVIPSTLSLAMSGCAAAHSDTGGYTTIMNMTRSKELLLRWEEMNVYSPLLRTHEGNQPARNAQYDSDPELLAHMAVCAKQHAVLKPYLSACMREAAEKGTPVMRPLFYHYDEAFAYTEMTEYLLGRDLLGCPVVREGQTERTGRLPKDDWICLTDGREYHGGTVVISAPVGTIPVFRRKRGAPIFETEERRP